VAEYRNVCYLIHFDEPVGGKSHYLGFAPELSARIAKHRASKGAAMTRKANDLGISWQVVRVWRDADRDAEVALKAMIPKNLCPYCNLRVSRQKARSLAEQSRQTQGRPL
jgi:predicted GIY-YIG superfamily endonuclease